MNTAIAIKPHTHSFYNANAMIYCNDNDVI